MKYWVLTLIILIANPLFAECKIDTHSFGTSSKKIEKSLGDMWGFFEPIPGVNREVTTNLEFICPELKDTTLGMNTSFNYHFIKDQLVAIELARQASDDLLLFEWGRERFGILEERDIIKAEQVIQVNDGDRIIQLFVGILPDAVFQNVVLISTLHDDLFDLLAETMDDINWDTLERPPLEAIILPEEN